MIIPLASISLLFRVIIQAKNMRRTVNWRSARKMTIQLVIISLLYLIFALPLAIISLIQIYFIPDFIIEFTFYFLYYAPYLMQLLTPFVCIMCLPEMWPRKNRVDPVLTAQPIHWLTSLIMSHLWDILIGPPSSPFSLIDSKFVPSIFFFEFVPSLPKKISE